MKYLIDSNTFIAPHRGYAPVDVAVSLWNKIKILADKGTICSLDMVKNELYENDDDLKQWMKSHIQSKFFMKFSNEETNDRLGEIMRWAAKHSTYSDKAKEKFMKLDKADVYLVAFASVCPEEWTVVSFERTNHLGSSEIKLPDVCSKFNVNCIALQDMFRALKETY